MPEQIRPMLAAKYDPAVTQKHLDSDGYLLIQPKIDGMRVLFDDGIARSRSWKEWTNRYLQAFARDYPNWTHGWDGEMIPGHSYDPNVFREAMSGLRSEDGAREFTIYLFDNYDRSYAHYPYVSRAIACYEDLRRVPATPGSTSGIDSLSDVDPEKPYLSGWWARVVSEHYSVRIVLCPTWEVRSLEAIDAKEAELLADGWEGAILRRPGRGYKWNRATTNEGSLTKIKRFETDEFVIDEVIPRYRNDNEATQSALGYTTRSAHQDNLVAEECVGAFRGHLLRNPEAIFNIGVLRFDHSTKCRLWGIRETLPGKILEFSHQGYGGGYDLPRTPVGLRFRSPIDL